MLSEKAKQEIGKLNSKLESLKNTKAQLIEEMSHASSMVYKALSKEENKNYNKIYSIETKIKNINKDGISTSEKNSLKREASFGNFKMIERSSSLGCRDYIKIGYSKTLNKYIMIDYTYFSGFMHNVKGCGSLANTYSINSVIEISKEEYDFLNK